MGFYDKFQGLVYLSLVSCEVVLNYIRVNSDRVVVMNENKMAVMLSM